MNDRTPTARVEDMGTTESGAEVPSPSRLSIGWLVSFAGLWTILSWPRLDGWWAGAVGLAVGIGLHVALGGQQFHRLVAARMITFGPWFLLQAIGGGLDVAKRAFSSVPSLEPGFIRYRLSIEDGAARIFFVNCISLLPGTFSAAIDGETVVIHHLADPAAASPRLERLECKVARLFGLRRPRLDGAAKAPARPSRSAGGN